MGTQEFCVRHVTWRSWPRLMPWGDGGDMRCLSSTSALSARRCCRSIVVVHIIMRARLFFSQTCVLAPRLRVSRRAARAGPTPCSRTAPQLHPLKLHVIALVEAWLLLEVREVAAAG
eukprot:2396485-Pleurochrysis_carterae.AAC.2